MNMIRKRFPDKFKSIEEGVLISIKSINDCTIKLTNGLIIKGRFVGKQNFHFSKIAKIDKKYFIAIYEDPEVLQGRILTITDFRQDVNIRDAITEIPNYTDILWL